MIEKRVTTLAFRHSLATDLLEGGTELRTRLRHATPRQAIHTLLDHVDPASRCYAVTSVKTTEIYTHVAKGEGALAVRSPLDRLVGRV